MAFVSFQVIDGVDKGRTFLNLETPVTIGREEGNGIRLNDDRVSRFHAKVQEDQGQVVLTDLDSTNGTRINGETVQLRLLRPGDRVNLGRSTLLFGTTQEIAASFREDAGSASRTESSKPGQASEALVGAGTDLSSGSAESRLTSSASISIFERTPPDLPVRLTPAQAAQLSEVLDFLHHALADAIDPVHIPQQADYAALPLANWQQVQLVLGFLASYSRNISDPGLRNT
ncbi:MAG: FHA domain-containing protein [Planctomycetota bacterium]